MSYWSFYFLAKVGLYYTGYIGFHWLPNLLLALALLWPLRPRGLRIARQVLAWPAGIALLYHDSFLPTPGRVLSQMQALAGFSLDYMLELLGRVFQWQIVLGFVVALVAYGVLSRRIRFSTFALGGILSVPLVAALGPQAGLQAPAAVASAGEGGTGTAQATALDPNAQLQNFYAQESTRKLAFTTGSTPPAFDIILLHVCSLAWDDMEYVGMRDHPLLQRFDAVFTKFNSAASYSGPASLRVLRGNCGQTPHKALYEGADASCYVFPSLEQLGYRTSALLNHDGVYEDFAKTLQTQGGLSGKFERNQDAPVHMHSFDGSPIYNDLALLSQWWKGRQGRGAEPVALYYNTVSLHDGNRVPGMASRSSLDTYKPRLAQLLADFDKFLTELENTGRPVVVLLVPEHGAALRGDKIQISGMREIPGPRITLVPAAMKIVGARHLPPSGGPVRVDQPTSYFGLYALLGDLLKDSPFGDAPRPLAERLRRLESTGFESENADVIVMRDASGKYLMKTGNGAWIPYTY